MLIGRSVTFCTEIKWTPVWAAVAPAPSPPGRRRVRGRGEAERLLAEGKRPTIERVRLKMGRGSPNTVSPMLERWFVTLGERLVDCFSCQERFAALCCLGQMVEAML